MKKLLIPLRVFFTLSIILGIFYPLFTTVIVQFAFKDKANGSLIIKDGEIIGSKLIGQSFTKSEYFQSRPSAINYDGQNSNGSNLGPTSKKLIERVQQSIITLKTYENFNNQVIIPADMVLESGSGLDPHISIENALLQLPRIAKIRGLPKSDIEKLIDNNIDNDFLGIWGQSAINVLKLNLALDSLNYANQR